MGCCFTSVGPKQSRVSAHSRTGNTVIFHDDQVVFSSTGCCIGHLYATDNHLHYVSKRKGRKQCLTRYKRRFRLSRVNRVEVIKDCYVEYGKSKCMKFPSGLKLSIGTNTTLVVAMHDAETLASKLTQITGGKTATLVTYRPNYFYRMCCFY